MLIRELANKNLINVPSFVVDNMCYLTTVGSYAYGTYNEKSDFDVCGFCVPPHEEIFPHLAGELEGFDLPKKKFEHFESVGLLDQSALGGKGRIYDINIYGIVRYFHLIMENNPSTLGSLFTPDECVLYSNSIGEMVRLHRKLFLHQGCWPRYKGFICSQIHKMGAKDPKGKRKQTRETYGYDTKHGMNLIRLLLEAEMILKEGDIEFRRNIEQLKAIRRGEISEDEVKKIASDKRQHLEKYCGESKLPWGPDRERIKALLLYCIEQQYGSLDKAIVIPDRYKSALDDVKKILDSVGIS